MILIPGWKLQISTEEIETYHIKLKYPQSLETLHFYIKKGDSNAKFPYSVFKLNDKNFGLITLKNLELKKSSFLIRSNLIKVKKRISFDRWDEINRQTLGIFVKQLLEMFIAQNFEHYSTSYEVKTYLGQYTKGRISNRKNPIDKIKSDFPYKAIYNLCEAEEFDVIPLKKDIYLITYVPRHEIFDEFLNLPQSDYIRNKIFEEWNKIYYHNIPRFIKRFNKINEIIEKSLKNQKILKLLMKLPTFSEQEIKYPTLLNENSRNKEIFSFRENYNREILNVINSNSRIDICIIIDKTIDIGDEQLKKIDDFIIYLRKVYTIKKIINLVLVEDKKSEKEIPLEDLESLTGNLVILLNNLEQGSSYIYREIKERVQAINKIITFKTIINLKENSDFQNISGSIFLSLNYRKNRNLLIGLNEEYYPLMAFSLIKNFEKNYSVIFSSSIIDKKFEIRNKFLPFFDIENDIELKKEVIYFIKNELRELKEKNKDTDIIVIFKNSFDIKNLLLDSIQDISGINLVQIKDTSFKMFKINNDKLENVKIPNNGTFITLNNNKLQDKPEICLLTNGIPDQPEKGTPNPLLLQILRSNDISMVDIINSIYYHTFLHPTSFSKSNLPIEYHLLNNIWKISENRLIKQNSKWLLL